MSIFLNVASRRQACIDYELRVAWSMRQHFIPFVCNFLADAIFSLVAFTSD